MPGRGGGGGRSIAATDYLTLRDKLFHAYYAKHSYLVTTCDDHMLTDATASFFSSSFFLYLFLYLLQILLRLWWFWRSCGYTADTALFWVLASPIWLSLSINYLVCRQFGAMQSRKKLHKEKMSVLRCRVSSFFPKPLCWIKYSNRENWNQAAWTIAIKRWYSIDKCDQLVWVFDKIWSLTTVLIISIVLIFFSNFFF